MESEDSEAMLAKDVQETELSCFDKVVFAYITSLKVRVWYFAVITMILSVCVNAGALLTDMAAPFITGAKLTIITHNIVLLKFVVFTFGLERCLDLAIDTADDLSYLRSGLLVLAERLCGVSSTNCVVAPVYVSAELFLSLPWLLGSLQNAFDLWYLIDLTGIVYVTLLTGLITVVYFCRFFSDDFVKAQKIKAKELEEGRYRVMSCFDLLIRFRGYKVQNFNLGIKLSAAAVVVLNISFILRQVLSGKLAVVVSVGGILIVLVLLNHAHNAFIKQQRSPMWPFMILFICLFLLILVVFPKLDMYGGTTSSTLTPSKKSYAYMTQRTDAVYPACLMRWGSPNTERKEAQLDIIDLAVFAEAMYQRGEDVMASVKNGTTGTDIDDVVLEELAPVETVGRWGVFKLPESKVRVVAVRGTNIGRDILEDVDLFATIALLQLSGFLFPVLSALPRELVRDLIEDAAAPRAFNPWEELVNATKTWKHKSEADGYSLVVTGHSLGGAYTAIAAAAANVSGVAFSPPGIGYTFPRFGLQDEASITRSLTAVQPTGDLVPVVDKQVGFTQHISCRVKKTLGCHGIGTTLCELYSVCGDPRGRDSRCADLGPYPRKLILV
eukprot:TRINITY_DN6606_c0_g2_i3.p1 TRINITY_DN6606_c0_g2~~TRINITY_DN6606_c0_g2_i3.p1  ORF type:complete len:611 (-),score=62.96 TRINITY_DN6606_c0_g2_i3:84-1916(-)